MPRFKPIEHYWPGAMGEAAGRFELIAYSATDIQNGRVIRILRMTLIFRIAPRGAKARNTRP
jgi:hypothetical protein